MGASIKTSTVLSYSSTLDPYLEFCRLHDFPITPSIDNLTFYIVFVSRHVPSTVSVYLSGPCSYLEPFDPNIRELHNCRAVSLTLAGCKKLYGLGERCKRRALTREELRALHSAYSSSTSHSDVLFWAFILTGFHALMRLGELVFPDCTVLKLQDCRKIIMRASVHVTPPALDLYLPGHKADRLFEGNHLEKLGDLDYLYTAFNSYMTSRDARFPYQAEL